MNRYLIVADLKEIYPMEFLLKNDFVTKEEYESIPASILRADDMKRAQDWAYLANRVVGYE